ncbi:MAG: mucoidy inhibitor MuiA family protein [Hyphomicrobium sp.]
MRMVAAALISALLATHARAAEVSAVSTVDAVTVFLSGAEVTRQAKVTIDKGEHTIVLNDVPAGAVPGSIRVEGKATGKLDVGSVDTARKFLQRAESRAADEQRKKLEDEIEALRDQRSAVEAQAQAAETQKALIANLAQLPTRPAPGGTLGAAPEDWGRVLALIAQGTGEAGRLQIDAQVKSRDLDRRIEDLEKKLSELVPPKTEQTEVRIHVVAASALEADVIVRYQIANANWTPIYDARLQTGSKTDPAKLALSRRAIITQRSGENWDNVTLQLSTARPSAGAAAPDVDTQIVDYEPELKPVAAPAPLAKARREIGQAADAMSDRDARGDLAASMAAEPAQEAIEEIQAAVTSAPFEATFAVPGKTTVAGTGEAKRVVLAEDELVPTLSTRTAPKVETNAYLYATFKLLKGTPLLPGSVYLFRDGTFVGSNSLPLLAPGVDHDLGFGVDDQIKVKYTVLEEKRGETGLISTSRVDNRNFRVTVKNLHERAIDIRVIDRIPVSKNDDIKVEYIGKLTPTTDAMDEKRGVIAFDAKLEPDEEKVLEYGYRVSWPAAKSIIYGP